MLKSKVQIHKENQARLKQEEQQQHELERAKRAASKGRQQCRQAQVQLLVQVVRQQQLMRQLPKPCKHKFLGDHVSLSVVQRGTSTDPDNPPLGICTSEVSSSGCLFVCAQCGTRDSVRIDPTSGLLSDMCAGGHVNELQLGNRVHSSALGPDQDGISLCCTLQVNQQPYIRTSHRFYIADLAHGDSSTHPGEFCKVC